MLGRDCKVLGMLSKYCQLSYSFGFFFYNFDGWLVFYNVRRNFSMNEIKSISLVVQKYSYKNGVFIVRIIFLYENMKY